MNILNLQGMSTDQVINNLGGIGVVAQHEKLQQDIRTLLLTRRGSVIGNPAYGSTLHTYLFDGADTTTLELVNTEINEILKGNYNFINEVNTKTSVSGFTLSISISYTTLTDNLSTKLEFNIPLDEGGRIRYE